MITLLRVMLVCVYVTDHNNFPWWLWLYGIMLEIDALSSDYLKSASMSKFIGARTDVEKTL